MPDKTVVITEDALAVIRRMQEQVNAVGRFYGTRSQAYAESAASMAHALAHVMLSGFGDARVMRDGPLSLFVNEQGFCYGVIFRERPVPKDWEHVAEAHLDGTVRPCEWTLHS